MDKHLDMSCENCSDRLQSLCLMEKEDTFTMNAGTFTDSKNGFLAQLKEAHLGSLDTYTVRTHN